VLYPQVNTHRQMTELNGFWHFRLDPQNAGLESGWNTGFEGGRPIAVPASWNEQFEDTRDYLGIAWYQTRFDLPANWRGQRIYVRFNSVTYLADVWLNGQHLGQHEGGHLPFVFEISDHLQDEENVLVVRVDGSLAPDRVPPGALSARPGVTFGQASEPDTSFDFFPYRGIDRPVLLFTTPNEYIEDVTVITDIDGTQGILTVHVTCSGLVDGGQIRALLNGHGADISVVSKIDVRTTLTLTVPDAAFWSPQYPNLYDLRLELMADNVVLDVYRLRVGIRTIAVEGNQVMLNGEPIVLLGFGRHEDFAVVGKGLLPALIIKDHTMMRWMGANSYRTSHYPYSEQQMDIADELGFLAIDETPAVGLFFEEEGHARRHSLCMQFLRELIDRDKNHPSVIMWSIANEPHSANRENQSQDNRNTSHPLAVESFREQVDLVRELDPTRLVTLASYIGLGEQAFEFMDVVCLNRYLGWYSQPGQIQKAAQLLSDELDTLYERFAKPVILSEFGTDTIPGHHAEPPEMFSEEYQQEFLEAYINVLNSKPYVVGQHIWNLADFKTSQSTFRVNAYNHKGVLTRDRRPKMAAHRLRELWQRDER
jgi:beta-glucuronidase